MVVVVPDVQVKHKPVLLDKVLGFLDLHTDDVVVDGTLGLGGHAKEILGRLGPNGVLIGFDLDSRNMQTARKMLKKYEGKVLYVNDSYAEINHYSKVLRFAPYNKVLLDLGVSSPHFDIAEYGFSFQKNGPLDMRFSKKNKVTAGIILNKLPESQLADVLFNFGELHNSRRIAAKIVEERLKSPFQYTVEFVERISSVVSEKDKHKTLACIFQALRIAVNDELNVLKRGLKEVFEGLGPGGILAVISYHSLEDRIVKSYFNSLLRPLAVTEEESLKSIHSDPLVENLTSKVVVPTAEETALNPRARSAKLRVIKKL